MQQLNAFAIRFTDSLTNWDVHFLRAFCREIPYKFSLSKHLSSVGRKKTYHSFWVIYIFLLLINLFIFILKICTLWSRRSASVTVILSGSADTSLTVFNNLLSVHFESCLHNFCSAACLAHFRQRMRGSLVQQDICLPISWLFKLGFFERKV